MRLDDMILLGALGLAIAAAIWRLGGLRVTFAALLESEYGRDADHDDAPTAAQQGGAPRKSGIVTPEGRGGAVFGARVTPEFLTACGLPPETQPISKNSPRDGGSIE
jgi:hypothetical protein